MKKFNLEDILYFILISVYIFSSYIFGTDKYIRIIHFIILFILVIIFLRGKIATNNRTSKILKLFLYGYLVLLFMSFFSQLYTNNYSLEYFSRSVSITVDLISVLLISYFSYQILNKKIENIVFASCVFGFLIMIIIYLKSVGINEFVNYYLNTEKAGNFLEFHALGYIFGMYFIYYFYICKNIKKALLSLIMCILVWKRIVLLAVVVSLLLSIIIDKIYSKTKKNYISIISIIMILIAYLYIIIDYNGILNIIANRYNIDFSHRLYFYDYFKQYYRISVLYFGHSLGFTDKIMETTMAIRQLKISAATGMHNDILRYYIDLGFLGSLVYYGLYFYKLPKILSKKFNVERAIKCLPFILFMYICLFVSNFSRTSLIMFVYFIFVFKTSERINDNHEK